LKQALTTRVIAEGMVLHSDRGGAVRR
jgi:hypothetical protein